MVNTILFEDVSCTLLSFCDVLLSIDELSASVGGINDEFAELSDFSSTFTHVSEEEAVMCLYSSLEPHFLTSL